MQHKHCYPAFPVLCPSEIGIFSKDILEHWYHIRYQKILKFLCTRARRDNRIGNSWKQYGNGIKDFLLQNLFHSTHPYFFSSIPISECIQPKTWEFKSKMCFPDSWCFVIHSTHVNSFIHIYELLPYIGHHAKHKRCKDGCNIFFTVKNIRNSG